jgi:PAS domain S-box-containing protein
MMDTSHTTGGAPHLPDTHAVNLDPEIRDVFDAAPLLIWTSGPDKLCTWFNRPWLDFTGRTMQQELGNGWTEGVHSEDLERCLNIYHQHFDEELPFRMQYRLRADDGSYRWIDDTGIPRYDSGGRFLGYIGACTDIHDARQIEMELRAVKQAAIGHGEMPLQSGGSGPPHQLPELVGRELDAILKTVLEKLELARNHMESGQLQTTQLRAAIGSALHAARQAPILTQRLLAFARGHE